MSHPSCDASCAPNALLPGAANPYLAAQAPVELVELPPPPLRRTRDRRRIDAWGLVLVSKGLQGVVTFADGVFDLYVPDHQERRARYELDAADAEEREQLRTKQHDAGRPAAPVTRHAVFGGVMVALLLMAFFAVTGPRAGGSAWFNAGAADAERVLQGEWWRAVTALTLHADGAHVASNIGIGALVVGAVMRSEGVGFGAALVLASGTLGNLLNAWAHQALHSSVGFSTAVFAAIGLLGGLTYTQSRGRGRTSRPAWTALGGSLALLAALGSSERSDLFAHLFGGLAGVGLGLLVGLLAWRPSTRAGQWLAGLGASAAVVAAWLVALR